MMDNVPELLKNMRTEAGLTQVDLAVKIGKSGYKQPVIAAIENGTRSVGLKVIEDWSAACGYHWELVFQKKS